MASSTHCDERVVNIGQQRLAGVLRTPETPAGLVLFAHGSGSSHKSPRNRQVAEALNRVGLATLLFDLLEPGEEEVSNRAMVFDIALLAERLKAAIVWVDTQTEFSRTPMGLFGASTGAAAALTVAAQIPDRIDAVVSRGGRPDMAGASLACVQAPTLLIVGGDDHPVLELNRQAYERLSCHKRLEIVQGATHLFEEPGAMTQVMRLACVWFAQHLQE